MVNTLPVLNRLAMTLPKNEVPDQINGIFRNLKPLPNAVNGIFQLAPYFNLHVLTTAPWYNPSAWGDKVHWVQQYFGSDASSPFYKKITMTHDKSLVHAAGGILIDDRPYHGASAWDDPETNSMWLQYGADKRLEWDHQLVPFLIKIAQQDTLDVKKAIDSANTVTPKYIIHGDLTKFQKASWE